MGKKVIGLAVTVALLMVVLSGCFLLPKPDTVPPTVSVVFPQNNGNIVVTSESTSITVKASVTAHSPIQSVTFTLSSAQYPQLVVDAQGKYGETSGVFTYTFTNLKPGTYTLTVKAYSSARFPGRATTMFNITTAVQNPIVGDITVGPNYHGHYVTKTPITFSAKVTNPNSNGTLNVTGTVGGEAANLVSANNGIYTFTYTPNQAGTYKFMITASLTVGTKTYVGSNSVNITVDEKPEATITQSPADYSVATSPVSFTFTTTSGVEAYLSVNGSTHSSYTSGTSINSYLTPDQWNTVALTFKDKWGNPLPETVTTHVLGTKASNPNDTPYVFLIDKSGHVVNTNDWIHVNAGDKIDLYGYILKGKDPINKYDIVESYYTNENLTTALYSGQVASETNLNTDKVPLRLIAYLFNEQASDTFIKFDIDVNDSAAAFLRYDVAPIASNSVSVNLSAAGDTYEGAPATINVTVKSKQPITSIALDQPFKVGEPFDGYATTTAYSNGQNDTNSMSFTYKMIAPVADVENKGIDAYGTTNGTFPFEVAFYGPSGTYQIGANVEAIANQSKYATTTYVVQADTAAPTIKIVNKDTNSVMINGQRVYYGPMDVVATVTDDHAIYWANFESSNATIASPTIVTYPNDSSIKNYGVKETSTTATVTFSETGPFTIWAVASDKHFDPTNYKTGNTANSITSIKGVYDDNAPSAKLVGGKYDIDATSEYYSFTIEATDGNGIGLANTANVIFTPVQGGTPTTVTAQLDPQTPGYYKVLVNTDSLQNIRYEVSVSVKDKLYDLIPQSATQLRAEHITTIETGYVTVHHNYPAVSISAVKSDGTTIPLNATGTQIDNDVFRININDPQFPWDWIDPSNYKNFIKITLAGPEQVFEPKTTLIAKHHTPGATMGYVDVEVPEIYFNSPATTASVPATVTMQVDVFDNVQPDKALFGRATAKFIPAEPLFTQEPVLSLGGNTVDLTSSTPVVAIQDTTPFDITFTLSGLAEKPGMELTFYANGVEVGTAPASNGTYTLNVPIQPDWQNITLTAVYAPSATVTYTASAHVSSSNYYSYAYKYNIGTFKVLGDTIEPSATITANGITVNSSTMITTSASLAYSVNGVAFYRHDDLTEYATTLGNTTINGQVLLTTANGQSVFATVTLGATDLLSATTANFTQGSKYIVMNEKLAQATEAGIYDINFTANDPFRSWNTPVMAKIVVDLTAPVINYAIDDVVPPANVPTISNASTLTFSVSDDAGVKNVSAKFDDLIYGNSKAQTLSLSATGIGAFSVNATDVVELPSIFAPQFQNLPYVLTINAEDVAGHSATPITRLFVTNVDHSPYVSKIIAVAKDKALVRLTEPMWVEGFKLFTANSTTYGGTITSTTIAPASILASYKGHDIANEFYVTFPYDVWNDNQVGSDVRTDLTNVEMSSSTSAYVPIVDLAGNEFAMPINTTTPPTLFVTPTSTTVGKGWSVTFTVNATSAAGIEKIVGQFNGQTKTIYAATGTMTFTAQTVSGTYTASFTAYDNSVNHNTTTQTANVYVNATNPIINSFTVPATVGSGQTFTATIVANPGSNYGSGNSIDSVTINGTSASGGPTTWTAQTSIVSNSGIVTIYATVTDKFGNTATVSKTLYVDNTPPTVYVYYTGTGINDSSNLLEEGTSRVVYTNNVATLTYSVFDNSNYKVTAHATFDGNAFTVGSNNTIEATGEYSANTTVNNGSVTLVATDAFGNTKNYAATLTVIVDNTPPTIAVATPATVVAASSTAIATYTATDIHFSSAYLQVSDSLGVLYSKTLSSPTQDATVDLRNDLDSLNGTTVTISLIATDLAGNTSSTSATFYVDTVNPTIVKVYRSNTESSSPIYITFDEQIFTTTGFASADITFISQATGYEYAASNVTKTSTGFEITVFDLNGNPVTSANLPSATYTVTVGNHVVDEVGNLVGNNNSSWKIGQ